MREKIRVTMKFVWPLTALTVALLVWPAATPELAANAAPIKTVHTTPAKAPTIEEAWGVEIVGIRLSAAGTMLDFRFRVIDPEKARPLVKRQAETYLVDEASGKKLQVPNPPKVGRLRQTAMEATAGKTYFAMFGNPGRMVASGDQVTVVIGEFRAQHLVVDAS